MSIFGQVWLWSLLAFLVGAIVAWLVLARPARKRVRELETELASAHADTARAAASTPARTAVLPPAEDWTRDRREHAPTEVIQATSAFEPEAEYDAEYRTAPEPAAAAEPVTAAEPAGSADDVDEAFAQAEAREHQAANGLFDSASAEGASEDSGSAYRAAATEYLQPVERDTGSHRIAEPAEDHDSGYHRIAEPVEEHDSGYHRVPEPLPEPEPPVEAEPDSGRHLREPADGLSSLERRLDPTPLDSSASEPEPVSLFRPGPGRATEPEPDWFSQPDGSARSAFEEPAAEPEQPVESAVGHLEEDSSTDHLIPNVEPVAESPELPEPPEPAESIEDNAEGGQGLPKRQRRESPRGGFDPPRPIQPSMRPVERREPDLAGAHSGSLFEPSVQPNQSAMAAPEPPPARQTADDAVPPGPFGPGSAMPRPGGGRPADGFTVKASVTALRYCGEDSPQFPKMVAEVWFRSAADAERVGFRPLH
ncbi:LapA family protein [Amycolatopsis silviterrae]|uniref:LapA family protein n=1 Tax=Amycolatopsis silviterrae TaxID=1656914 RepID=A0ABW5H123_9PSEU